MQCARPPHTRESRAVTVLSKKKKKDEKKKSLRRFRRHRPSFWFSLGTVKNENVLYYFLHVRVLQDSDLLNFTVLLFRFSDISSGKFERVVSRRRELEVFTASNVLCKRQLSHVEEHQRASEQTALSLLVGLLKKCLEVFRKRPSGQKDTLLFCHVGLKIRCRRVSVVVCAKKKKKKNDIGTYHSLLRGIIIPRSTARPPLLRRGGWLGFPRVVDVPPSRHECLSLGNPIPSPAGREYLGTPTPSHLSEEADKSVPHEWSSSTTRRSECRIPLGRLTGGTFSECFQQNLCFSHTRAKLWLVVFPPPVPEGFVVPRCFWLKAKVHSDVQASPVCRSGRNVLVQMSRT